ncbi:MAG: hypothetical protein K8R13_03145, partial [Methanococcoides sp.]|nr:hypothetical protein [Methanococcoides sp.]
MSAVSVRPAHRRIAMTVSPVPMIRAMKQPTPAITHPMTGYAMMASFVTGQKPAIRCWIASWVSILVMGKPA